MKRFIPFLLLFSISLLTNAQEKKTVIISGTVYEEKSNEVIPFAHISLSNNLIGTISNEKGKFKILIPEIYKNEEIKISFIGYETQTFQITSIPKNLECYLKPLSQVLNEIEIFELSTASILKKAYENISINYYQQPYKSKGFYRLTSKKDGRYVHLSEAVFDIYRSKLPSKKNQFKLEKMRALKDERVSHGIQLGLNVKSVFGYDFVNSANVSNLLSKKGLKNHHFSYEGIQMYNDQQVYVISFDQKDDLKKSGYSGKLLIDTTTFAFLYIEFGLSKKGIAYNKFGDASYRLLMNIFDIHLAFQKDQYVYTYKKIGEKYYLNNTSNSSTLNFRSTREHYDFTLDTQVDYLVTEIETQNCQPFSKDMILGNAKFIENQNSKYDKDFWKAHTIILPNSDFTAIAKEITASNKAHDYKKEIKNILRKYPKDKTQRIDSILTYYNQKGLFNGNALITYKGEKSFQKSYNNKLTQNNKNTQFRIASTSKTFTSMLIMMLENEGKLKISDPINKYLPGYKHGHITIAQLLTHQSGLPDYIDIPKNTVKLFKNKYEPEEIVKLFCSDSLEFEPGSKFSYTNSGYVILSSIIEKVTNQSFGNNLKERIFTPLKMHHTYFGTSNDTINMAKGFLYGQPEPTYPIENAVGAAGIITTTADLLKWSSALDQNKLLPAKKMAELFEPRAYYEDWEADYGYGWMIDKYYFKTSKKHPLIYHPGTDLGFYSMFLKQPDKDITIILLSNTGYFPRFEITELILEELN